MKYNSASTYPPPPPPPHLPSSISLMIIHCLTPAGCIHAPQAMAWVQRQHNGTPVACIHIPPGLHPCDRHFHLHEDHHNHTHRLVQVLSVPRLTEFLHTEILSKPRAVLIKYITSTGFLLDVLAVLPLELLSFIWYDFEEQWNYFPIFRLNRLIKFRKVCHHPIHLKCSNILFFFLGNCTAR